jgi:hypothetical protein
MDAKRKTAERESLIVARHRPRSGKRSSRSYSLVSGSSEGVRVPFSRETAREIARRISRGSRLTYWRKQR